MEIYLVSDQLKEMKDDPRIRTHVTLWLTLIFPQLRMNTILSS
jgi:hypothetical protein